MLTLKNSHGYQVTLLETGGAIQSILMPDREGKLGDIVLGFDDPADYPGMGSIGAFVGRYANRIAGGSFQLNGKTYAVTRNEGENTLHGGYGYHLRRWDLEPTEKGAALTIFDPDGKEGFPGNVRVRVDVQLTEANELILDYTAQSDADTVIKIVEKLGPELKDDWVSGFIYIVR